MNSKSQPVSPSCRRRLHAQGYQNYSDQQLGDFKIGIRFAYGLCTILFATGLFLTSPKVLMVAATVAFLGAFPPYHPFDYLYNYVVRHFIRKPKLPSRSNQGRFACGIASVWLTTIIFLIMGGNLMVANILGGLLLVVALLVTTTDICIPSMVYNFLFGSKPTTNNVQPKQSES
jgi:hypothetical protein